MCRNQALPACDTCSPQDSADDQLWWGLGSENTNGNYPLIQKTEWMTAPAAGCGLQIPALLWLDYLFFLLMNFTLLSDTSFAISSRASINTACGFTSFYIIFALISVFLRQRTEAKFCPRAGIHFLPRAQPGATRALSSQTHVSVGTPLQGWDLGFALCCKMLCTIPVLTTQQKVS